MQGLGWAGIKSVSYPYGTGSAALPERRREDEIMNHSITAPATKITKSYRN
jgi:hypothetical protein